MEIIQGQNNYNVDNRWINLKKFIELEFQNNNE